MLVLLTSLICAHADEERKIYIVYMGAIPSDPLYIPSTHHISLLQNITGPSFSEKLIVATFDKSFNGFAAKMTRDEAEELSRSEDIVSVFPERTYELTTTRSWDFLGLTLDQYEPLELQSDIIIGVIDSGIWPELETFSDEDFDIPPGKWKGVCEGGKNFTCNRKVIGARYYGYLNSARDEEGHGTHCASVAAGVPVNNISFYGLANGTARGGAVGARIAVYRPCHNGCSSMGVMRAFHDAINDGVDVISASLTASTVPLPFDEDVIAIGAFHAMAKGIVTSNSAGNTGKHIGIKSNAPWMISVAASTLDRGFVTDVVLGDGTSLRGNSIQTFDIVGHTYPLVDRFLFRSYRGKIIADRSVDPLYAASVGAVGCLYTSSRGNFSKVEPLAAAFLSSSDFDVVLSYMRSDKNPIATMFTSLDYKDKSAPLVAPFSARGPNSYLPEIMKPDVTAPGVAILAGYSPVASISGSPDDERRVEYNFQSGTSMSCPHVSGIAAYIKSNYPDWSPSAIQSAIMTTATSMDDTTNPDGVLAYGSGQVNPFKATDPGLVYEATRQDYINLLCRNGYTKYRLGKITGDYNTNCSSGANQKNQIFDFNYPALTAKVEPNTSFTLEFHRTLTNVGLANSTYRATIIPNRDLNLYWEPAALVFTSLNQKISFSVTVTGEGIPVNSFRSAEFNWIDDFHLVRTPIVVHTITPKRYV